MNQRVGGLLVAAVLLVGGCGSSKGSGSVGFPVSGPISISNTGKVAPADHASPLPIGTVFTFDGWNAKLLKSEHSTQDSPSPTNPRASVVQVELELTAPTESEADYTDRPPFEISSRTNGSDMAPCARPEPWTPLAPGETRNLAACLTYFSDDKIARQTPTVTVVARYGGFNHTAALHIECTRGPDY